MSVIVIEPVLLPAAVGVNVTLMAQLAPAAKLVPQVLSCAKSPVDTMLAMVKALEPVLLNVTVCGALVVPKDWLEKVRLVTDKLTTGTGRPSPASKTVCGLFAALSVMVTVPYRLPSAVGVKVTDIVQAIPGATLDPQVLSWAKSPLTAMDVMLKAELPVLVRVTGWAALVLPTTWPTKVKLVGAKVTTGA